MFKQIIFIISIVKSMAAFSDEDCESITKNAASAISFKDRSAAIEILSDRDQARCLLPEYILKLKILIDKSQVKENHILKFPRRDINNPVNMQKLCTHELERIHNVRIPTNKWNPVNERGFSYLNYQCTIVIDGDYIDAMIQQ